MSEMRARADVLYVEPNYTRRVASVPNDPLFAEQWNMGAPFGIHASDAWAITTGRADIVIALIDTGLDSNHADLLANVYRNAADCDRDGIDSDANGFIDDCHGANAITRSGDALDDNGHGTAMAGIIGATGNDHLGIAGVNWSVSTLPCKALGANGEGRDADIIACFDYIAAIKQRGANVVAVCAAFSGPDKSQALEDAIAALRERGILVIAAAGNDAFDNAYVPAYPASYVAANVISVAATTSTGALAPYSNFGTTTVHIAAPGEQILTTALHDAYAAVNGTSAAAAHVAGMAALIAAAHPADDWKQIRNRLLSGRDTSASLSTTIAGGRGNVFTAIDCNNATLLAPVLPSRDRVSVNVDSPVAFAAFDIDCDRPADAPQVQIGTEILTLRDDGLAPDDEPGDGLYAASWIAHTPGDYTFRFANGYSGTITVTSASADNPVPAITMLQPNSWAVDDSPVAVIVRGTGFTQSSVIHWDGTARPTTYISDTELYTVAIGSDLASAATHAISVFNPAPGGGTSSSAAFTVGTPDFTVRASSQTVSVPSGQTSAFTLAVEPAPVFRNAVTFSCAGLPAPMQCSFAPASVTPGTAPVQVTVTITGTKQTNTQRAHLSLGALWTHAALACAAVLALGRKKRRRASALVIVCVATMFTACGGAGRQVSTAPSSPITTITAPVVISASGGNVVHSVTISVVYTK